MPALRPVGPPTGTDPGSNKDVTMRGALRRRAPTRTRDVRRNAVGTALDAFTAKGHETEYAETAPIGIERARKGTLAGSK